VAYRNSTIFSTKFKAPSRLWVRCLRSWIWASSHGQTRLGRDIRSQREKQHNTVSLKAQQSSPRGQATSRNRNFALFVLICLIFFLIPYYLNWKHNNFQLNWTEGVACRNYTIFGMKIKPPSQLWVRCLRSWIWASSDGQTRLGRHNISQRKNNKTRSARKLDGAHDVVRTLVENQILHFLLVFFWYFFLILYRLNRKHTNF
jgi:hypothetical protein